MKNSNKHGLDRYIPEPIKKQIRERCGFGCVFCGQVPVEYHHHHVPFADAKEHNPEDIVLLCDGHHKKVTNKHIDADDISNALRTKSGENSKTRFVLPSTKRDFFVNWASNKFFANFQAIVIDHIPTLQFDFTPNPLEPVIISGTFQDNDGNVLCEIKNNEFVFRRKNCGDFNVRGNKFVFKLPNGSKSLEFELTSQSLNISKIFHCHKDAYVFSEDAWLYIGNWKSGSAFADCTFNQVHRAIDIESCFDSWVWQKAKIKKNTSKKWEAMTFSAGPRGVFVGGMGGNKPAALVRT